MASRLHRILAWFALIVLFVWVLSGFLHPLMSLLAPLPTQRAAPPATVAVPALSSGLPAVLAAAQGVAVARTVPGPDAALWQLTEGDGARRYLSLDGTPWSGSDQDYARWLAGWYLGEERGIRQIERIDQFNADYPWVNRLLPVWAIAFEGDDGLVAYIHTETGVLASLSDSRRRLMQNGFRYGHTLAFLNDVDPLRRGVIAAAMGVLLLIGMAGAVLWWTRAASARAAPARRWHRRLALLAGLPLLAMAASGLIHAFWRAGDAPDRGLSLPPVMAFEGAVLTDVTMAALPEALTGQPWTQASLSTLPGSPVVLALRPPRAAGWGAPVPEATVLDLANAQLITDGELALARAAAHRHGLTSTGLSRVDGFGPDYDFRNRRLPAWIATTADGQRIALDPDTAQRLDVMSATAVAEAWIFSIVHKWQPLSGLLGSPGRRDAVQVALLSLALTLAVLGIRLDRRRNAAPSSLSLESS